MVRRRGFACSLAVAFVFSSLLASNFILLSSSEDRARLEVAAERMRASEVAFQVGAGIVAYDALLAAQARLESSMWSCSSAESDVFSALSGTSTTASVRGVNVTGQLSGAFPAESSDNLSMVSPFNGSGDRTLDLRLSVVGLGGRSGGVSLHRVETHSLHLDARLSTLLAFCLRAAYLISEVIASQTACNMTALTEAVASLQQALDQHGASLGFRVRLEVGLSDPAACSVGYGVEAWQPSISGPGGTFRVSVEAEGTASPR